MSEAGRRRLLAQQIASQNFATPAEVVAWMGALQAQDYAGALWAVGLRLPAATEASIEQALAAREIVRTWPLRGTLHIVAAADVRWMLELLAPRALAKAAGRRRQLGLDEETLARSAGILERALEGGRALTRPAAFAELEAAGVSTAGQRGIHILGYWAQRGLLCLGARAGKQQTFTLLGEWIPQGQRLPRDEALAELALRYFTSHGPATLQDFEWWSGLTVADARAGIAAVAARLSRECASGSEYWAGDSLPSPVAASATGVHLLPGFDEFLLGYTDRRAVLDPRDAPQVHPGANGVFKPLLVIDGRVAGTWRRAIAKKKVSVEFAPFAPLGAADDSAAAVTAGRYVRFLGLDQEP